MSSGTIELAQAILADKSAAPWATIAAARVLILGDDSLLLDLCAEAGVVVQEVKREVMAPVTRVTDIATTTTGRVGAVPKGD